MSWPKATDYNEAIQNPRVSFRDPELKAAHAVLNPLGLPMPRSGNFADVYELRCPTTNRSWAVKCFTREVPGLEQRYAAISLHLQKARLPFAVDFKFLSDGICVRGVWFPVVKMRWIEGFTLNEFVAAHVDRRPVMNSLADLWLRLARDLRDAEIAHGDLQHGNVLLVPGSQAASLALRLIDYDGMYVPALMKNRSGEVGHANYQHPDRIRDGLYGFEMDRFPHLVVYTAFRALALGGQGLWKRFDTGDNLLFRESDFRTGAATPVFQALWDMSDPEVRDLTGHLLLSLRKSYDRVPLLNELVKPEGVYALSSPERKQVQDILKAGQAPPEPERTQTPRIISSKEPWWQGAELANKPAAPSSSTPASRSAAPVKAAAIIDEDPLKQRLDKKKKRKRREQHSNSGVYMGLTGLALCCVILVIAGLIFNHWLVEKPSETPTSTQPFTKTRPPGPPSKMNPGGAPGGPGEGPGAPARAAGLIAELFTGKDLRGAAVLRVHPNIHFAWGLEPPEPGLEKDQFSVRWTGWLRVPSAGHYKISTHSEDGVRVKLDDDWIITDWNSRRSGPATSVAEKDLTQGDHPIVVEYFAEVNNSEVHLMWEGPGIASQWVPANAFVHDPEALAVLTRQQMGPTGPGIGGGKPPGGGAPRATPPGDDRIIGPAETPGAGGSPGGGERPGIQGGPPGKGQPSRPDPNTKRNPFGEEDVPDPDGADAIQLAVNSRWVALPTDANQSWLTPPVDGDKNSIEGDWHSRWDRGDQQWHEGTATVRAINDRVFIRFHEGGTRYLIEGRRWLGNRLVGRYVNLGNRSDSTPWIALIVSPERIDGSWTQGRWDLRRQLKR